MYSSYASTLNLALWTEIPEIIVFVHRSNLIKNFYLDKYNESVIE